MLCDIPPLCATITIHKILFRLSRSHGCWFLDSYLELFLLLHVSVYVSYSLWPFRSLWPAPCYASAKYCTQVSIVVRWVAGAWCPCSSLFVEASEGLSCGHHRRPSCKTEMLTGQSLEIAEERWFAFVFRRCCVNLCEWSWWCTMACASDEPVQLILFCVQGMHHWVLC